MSRKFSEARKQAFLKGVRETGNQTIAAERAKVSRSWVQLHRSTDPQFDADCRAAIAEAKESLAWAPDRVRGTRGSNRPPSGWGHLDGEELVVKGTGGSGGGKRVQIARARLKQWTPRVEDRFLATLAATCNVKAACAAVAMTAASAYAHRKRWPGFAARWDAAIEAGYERLEEELTASAIAFFEPPEPGEPWFEPVVEPMSVRDCISIVRLHERRAREAAARRLGRVRGCGPRWPGVAAQRMGRPTRDGKGRNGDT
jgi:hypothetical protein